MIQAVRNIGLLSRSAKNNPQRNQTPSLRYQYNLSKDTVSFGLSKKDTKLFSCKDSSELGANIADELGIEQNESISKKFKNGETYVKLNDDVDGKSVVVINSGNDPVNDNLMEFRQLIDASKRNGAEKITAVVPYLPYSRQDRLSDDGESLAAKMVAEDLERTGADKIITVDLHSPQIQGFFDIPVKNLSAIPMFADYFKKNHDDIPNSFVVVSPDSGGEKRAKKLAKELGTPVSVISKERAEHNKAEAVSISGDVKDKNCILVDDMIDTAGSITAAVNMLKSKGANDIYIAATHGIFSGAAYDNIKNCPVKEVVVTDSLPLKEGAPSNIKQLSIAGMVADELN